jgi:hypothetical protein
MKMIIRGFTEFIGSTKFCCKYMYAAVDYILGVDDYCRIK